MTVINIWGNSLGRQKGDSSSISGRHSLSWQLHCCTIGDLCTSRLRPPVIYQSNRCPWNSRNRHPNPFISKDESMSESVCQVSVKAIKQASLYSWRWLNFTCDWSVLFFKDCSFDRIIEGKWMQLACCWCLIRNRTREHAQPFHSSNNLSIHLWPTHCVSEESPQGFLQQSRAIPQ